jgi:hypothetical protein
MAWFYLAVKPFHVGADVDGLAYPCAIESYIE